MIDENVPALLQLAQVQEYAGNRAEAEKHYRTAMALEPDDAKIPYNLAMLLEDDGRNDEATLLYQQALSIDGQYKQAWNNLGLLLKRTGDLEGALAAFVRATECDGSYQLAWKNLGAFLAEHGEYEAAKNALEIALELNAADQAAKDNYERLLAAIERSARVQQAAARAHAPTPDDAIQQVKSAKDLEARGDLSRAEQAYRRALDAYPNYHVALAGLGSILYGNEDYPAARDLLLLAVRDNPGDKNAWYTLSLVYEELGDLQAACQARQKSEALNCSPAGSSQLLPSKARNTDNVIDMSSRRRADDQRNQPQPPKKAASNLHTGLLTRYMDKLPISNWKKWLTVDPGDPFPLIMESANCLDRGETKQALDYLNKAVACDPKRDMSYHARGCAALVAGDYALAAIDLETWLSMNAFQHDNEERVIEALIWAVAAYAQVGQIDELEALLAHASQRMSMSSNWSRLVVQFLAGEINLETLLGEVDGEPTRQRIIYTCLGAYYSATGDFEDARSYFAWVLANTSSRQQVQIIEAELARIEALT